MSNNTIDDGGSVTASLVCQKYMQDGAICEDKVTSVGGLSIRDYFAASEKIRRGEHFELELCEALAGKRPEKDRKTDPIAWEMWQATWQAKIRFIRSDAMLAARKEKP